LASGTLASVPNGVHADATFNSGKVSGSAGCNGFSGTYTTSGSSLSFGPIASTQMACQPPADTVETAYLANLSKTASYTVGGDSLTLLDASGAKLLIYAAAQSGGLTGVTWHATAINNGKQAVVSVAAGSDPTAIFATDGTISGNASCNTYNGPVRIEGNLITIGPLVSTKMACASEDLNNQEAAFLAALQAAETYDIRGDRLELRDSSTALMAEFQQR